VGPLLFAITTYVATIGRLAEATPELRPPVQSVRETVAMLQGAVRGMLQRLRDVDAEGLPPPQNLAVALEELLGFWRRLRPGTQFELVLDMDTGGISEAQHAALLRVAQEAVSNAVRHGAPGRVVVELMVSGGAIVLRVADDGAGGAEGRGYGLPGMRERLAALGGGLEVRRDQGWTLTASAPLA
jgi:two-component system sensor histidine kinase UhpB